MRPFKDVQRCSIYKLTFLVKQKISEKKLFYNSQKQIHKHTNTQTGSPLFFSEQWFLAKKDVT